MLGKKLIVDTIDCNPGFPPGEDEVQYSFPVWELDGGAILVPSESTHDYFFRSRDDIEPNGTGFVSSIEETGETTVFSQETLKEILDDCIQEFGEDESTELMLSIFNEVETP